jgi:PAS domain S-box-containing protein
MNSPEAFSPANAYELLVQGVVDYAIYMLDPEGRVATWNAGAERIKGYAAPEIVGQHFSRFYTPEDTAAGLPWRVLETARREGRYEAEGWRVRRDGSRFWAGVVVDAIHDGGALVGFAKITRDLTERREAQLQLEQAREQLFQAQKMEAVGQLTGGLAHDFNNLLTGITGSLELLQTRLAQGRLGDLERHVLAAQGAARRAAALTQRLLAFARRQTLDPKPTDVNRLVAGMEELVRRTMGPAVEIEVVGAAGLWAALVDPNQLEGALLNLCINARDAMPESGRLTIETANKWLDERAGRERDLPPGQYLSLCVTDTGTGMAPEVARRAFDPFFTTKPLGLGTGLGLSMIHGFARQSGGQVRIHSEVGRGTTVCLYLPRHHGQEGGPESPAGLGEAPRAGQGETVLVVDDEPTVRALVAEALGDLGYAALEAGDGPAGLRVLRSGARVDLLVTDVGLPGGMNGRQLADAGRALRPGLRVLFITGYAENAAVGNGHLEPGMHVLTKPFAVEALASRVRAIIGQA